MSEDIVTYYNRESTRYSAKRYEGTPETYVKYFFQKRLSLLMGYLGQVLGKEKKANLLDVGCADGFVVRAIDDEFPNRFTKIVGIDIAPQMIEEANIENKKSYISFFSRDDVQLDEKFDIILEVGFLSPSLFEQEFEFVLQHLKPGGHYICSLTSKNSLHAFVKLRGKKESAYIYDYHSYPTYEEILRKHFEILSGEPCGFFVPKLWAFPALARVLQPLFDSIFQHIAPNIFHEKLYLLRKR